MHNYEVPVFVNGHGFMVRLEGEFKQKDIHTFSLKTALPLKERQVVGEIKNESIKLPNSNIHSENISVNNSDIQKMVIRNNVDKKRIDVNTYRFSSGQTIDEILKTQTSWSTDEQCLLNIIDSNWRAVENYITKKEK